MPDVNAVILAGRICKDPEVKFTPKGTAVTELNLAINKTWRTEGGEDRKEVCFVPVTVWGKQAENCGKFLEKGSAVLVEGELKYEEWEAKDGGKRHALKVTAARVQFLTFKDKKDNDEENEKKPQSRAGDSERSNPPF